MAKSLVRLRRKHGVSQRELARKLGVTPSYICKVERDAEEPSDEFMHACEQALAALGDEPATEVNRLWEYRNRTGMTQRELAKALHCSPSYVSRVEKGTLRPTDLFVTECARLFGVRASRIFPEPKGG